MRWFTTQSGSTLTPPGSGWHRIDYTATSGSVPRPKSGPGTAPLEGAFTHEGRSMRNKRRSRRSFLIDSVAGVNAAWVAANYHGILAAQEYVRQATGAGQ